MGNTIQLTASDGHAFDAYRADADEPKGGLVVIQEIFGVNAHIRELCDKFASLGYSALAPALFDRAERGVELGYDEAAFTRAREIRPKIAIDDTLKDIDASTKALAEALPGSKIGVAGYCWGGTLAWLAATRLEGLSATVCYYGGQIVNHKDEIPRCPVLMNFGETDTGIPLTSVDEIREAQPDIPIHVYPGAGHGFSCDHRSSYDAEQSAIAEQRTLAFFGEQLV